MFNQKDSFDDDRLNSLSINSYNISQRLYTVKKVAAGTTDVFLYGHSTFRDYVVPKGSTDSVRGSLLVDDMLVQQKWLSS